MSQIQEAFERFAQRLQPVENMARGGKFGVVFGPSNKFVTAVYDGAGWGKRFSGKMSPDRKKYFTDYNEEHGDNEEIFVQLLKDFIDHCHQERVDEIPGDVEHILLRSIQGIVITAADRDESFWD